MQELQNQVQQHNVIISSLFIVLNSLIYINIERVGRTEQHMVESLKVVEEKLWTDLAIYCHVC